jgi:hypothetical protein
MTHAPGASSVKQALAGNSKAKAATRFQGCIQPGMTQSGRVWFATLRQAKLAILSRKFVT